MTLSPTISARSPSRRRSRPTGFTVGLVAAAALLRPALEGAAIGAIGSLAAGLFTGRAIGALVDGGLSSYTVGALMLESTLAFLSLRLLR